VTIGFSLTANRVNSMRVLCKKHKNLMLKKYHILLIFMNCNDIVNGIWELLNLDNSYSVHEPQNLEKKLPFNSVRF
jgi:hypothetical protein